MEALITGASSGIGREIAKYLSSLGYDLIIVARDKSSLQELAHEVKTKAMIFNYDLSNVDDCYKLYNQVKTRDIQIVVNNAGFGLFGDYTTDKLETDLNMIDLNIKALHIFTSLFINKNSVKYILNVGSSAGLMKGGPLMSTYYATKSYVVNYTLALYEELRRNKSDKRVSILCPGPVNTNFNKRANVKFNFKGLSKEYVSKYAIKKMFQGKLIIIPGIKIKVGIFLTRFIPIKILLRITYHLQRRKSKIKAK